MFKITKEARARFFRLICHNHLIFGCFLVLIVMTLTDMHDAPEIEALTSSSNATSKEFKTTPSGSVHFELGNVPPQDYFARGNADAALEESGSRAGYVEEESETRLGLPPSRLPTLLVSHEKEPVEQDLTDWHPLDRPQSESKDLDQTQDMTFVEDSVTHGIDEKHVPTPSPQAQTSNSNLQVVTKTSSPQPWEVINPPPSNNGDATDYYSTLGTKNFGTLQKKARSRPTIPQSSYYFGPPPMDAFYGTNPVGHIGIHHPREVFRVERDYTGGELVQFASTYPLELEGRITPTQFLETINAINELLISAHSIPHSFFNNLLVVLTFQISRLVIKSHYEKEMRRLEQLVQALNTELYNPVGLNIRWPRKVAFLFLEIEYY